MNYPASLMLYSIAFILFVGCEQEKEPKQPLPIHNTTTLVPQKPTQAEEKAAIQKENTFTFHHTHKKWTIELKEHQLICHNATQEVTLITLFDNHCPLCQAEVAMLTRLQKAFKTKLQVIGVNLSLEKRDSSSNLPILEGEEAKRFASVIKKALSLEESLSLPLSILYHKKEEVTYYEGAVPSEILTHTLQNIIKQ